MGSPRFARAEAPARHRRRWWRPPGGSSTRAPWWRRHSVVIQRCFWEHHWLSASAAMNGSWAEGAGDDSSALARMEEPCESYSDDSASCAASSGGCVYDEGSQVCTQPCELLSKNDSFGKLVQAALAMLALGVLLAKRQLEDPPRPIRVWAYDISKQCASMSCAHIGGMLNAIILSGLTRGGDECSWYLISFTVDTTVGVTISIYAMRLVASTAKRCGWDALQQSGYYGPGKYIVGEGKGKKKEVSKYVPGAPFVFDDPWAAAGIWFKQLSVWCVITVAARACCGVLMYTVSNVLQLLSEVVSDLFVGHPKLFLVLVRPTRTPTARWLAGWLAGWLAAPNGSIDALTHPQGVWCT